MISSVIDQIKSHRDSLARKRVTAGFDGFVDTIAKIIRNKEENQKAVFFNSTKDFGDYILQKHGSSFSLEFEEKSIKLGGNMPIMANALGHLGIHVNCIGAFGLSQTHPAFKTLSSNCELYSFADPGTSTAYEFSDGKMFLAQMGDLNSLGWDEIACRTGADTLIRLYKESDLISIVNWSEIDASTNIWKGLLKNVFPHFGDRNRTAFFDLSDCSKRSGEKIIEALTLLKEFSKYARVILGLNRNEARLIYEALYNQNPGEDLTAVGEKIFDRTEIDMLLIHSSKKAIAWDDRGRHEADTFFLENPRLSTGAGDNFNAGFCAAQLLEMDTKSCVIFANAVSGYHVKYGMSPALNDVIEFLERNKMS